MLPLLRPSLSRAAITPLRFISSLLWRKLQRGQITLIMFFPRSALPRRRTASVTWTRSGRSSARSAGTGARHSQHREYGRYLRVSVCLNFQSVAILTNRQLMVGIFHKFPTPSRHICSVFVWLVLFGMFVLTTIHRERGLAAIVYVADPLHNATFILANWKERRLLASFHIPCDFKVNTYVTSLVHSTLVYAYLFSSGPCLLFPFLPNRWWLLMKSKHSVLDIWCSLWFSFRCSDLGNCR